MNNFNYLETNNVNQPTILFIHGFGASKTFVNRLVALKPNFKIIALTLPNKQNPSTNQSASIADYANYVKDFIKAKKLKNFYIFAHSLGGAIASFLKDLKEVKKFILAAPLPPYVIGDLQKMKEILLPNTLDQAKETLKYLVEDQKLWANSENFVAKSILAAAKSSQDFYWPLLENEAFNFNYLTSVLQKNYQDISEKATLIIALNDQITKKEYLLKMAQELTIPVFKIEKCGHALVFEKPEEVRNIIEIIINDD